MESRMNRRNLLKVGAAFSVVGGTQFFTGIPALADYAAGPTVRRNAFTMAANDPILRGYVRAIKAMRALPNNNPCSWFYQAAIHGTNDPSNLPAWNTCHTDPQFFWAWHRMYLYWFERIVRKYSGMYDWAIPFWDWANPAQRALPPAFRDSNSLLFDASRNPGINSGTQLSTSLATSIANAMTSLSYFNAQSGVNGPHGIVHGAVSGNMCCVPTAAKDPIFWSHHAMIDRLWNLWLAQGGGRSSPVTNSTWRNSTYTFFDECCQSVKMKGCDVLRAAAQLSYVYEGEQLPQVNQYCPLILNPVIFDVVTLAQARLGILLGARPVRTPLLPREAREAGRRIRDLAQSGERSIALHIRNIEADSEPGIGWEVHVGPRGFTPGPRSLVGMFALFSAGLKDRKQHYHPAEFVFPIGAALRGQDPASLEVAFVPVSGLDREPRAEALQPRSQVRVGEIAVIVDSPMPPLSRDEQERLRKQEESQ